ncbi:MAG: MerC domain-containing protein [Bacteroidia bacterium]|nr:MerC domain-containing protein [Bacteroidia bacterium]
MLDIQLKQEKRKSDVLGATASGLCLIHCLATPFLFVAQAGVSGHHEASPAWWGAIDIILLVVSLAAVYWAVKKTSKQWIKIALILSWVFLAFLIFNEKFEGIHLAEAWIYVPTASLIVLHLYNRKYCYCDDEEHCETVEG